MKILSSHGHALARIAEDPNVRVSDIAASLQVTERSAQRLVSDLISAGYVRRRKAGRRADLVVTSDELRDALQCVEAADVARRADDASVEPTRKDEILARLTEAVQKLLESGEPFAGLSVERLIRAAGVSRSTFYSYFHDKDDLLRALLDNLLDDLWSAARRWIDLDAGLTKDDLRAAMEHIGAVHRPRRFLMRAVAEADPSSSRVRSQYDDLMQSLIDGVRQHIERGQRQTFVAPELDPEGTAALLVWGSDLRLNSIAADASDESVARVVTALTDVVWNLLYAGIGSDAGARR
ncbi:MAG: TetR family transcriptional regulator [Solirubrobacteraceae bacterium]